MQLSYIYRVIGDSANALKEIQAALLLSPRKEEFLIEKGTVEWDMGDVKAAAADFNAAYALGPGFTTLANYAAAGDIAAGDKASADKILLAAYGTTIVDSDVLSVAYYRAKDWPSLIALWKLRAGNPSANAQTLFGLASAYYVAGDMADAIATINDAVKRFPDAAASGAAALKQIEGK
jgi:tetratricopeptide (TPR) repeat protein